MKTVIIGSIYNLSLNDLLPFIITLEKTGYDGDIVFFCRNISDNLKNTIKKFGNYKFINIQNSNMHINNDRFFYYLRYLKYNKYDFILFTDVRDVFFQKNPFDYNFKNYLYSTLEEKYTIGTCPINSSWFKKCYNDEIFKNVYYSRISCAGTIFGDYTSSIKHIQNLCNELNKIKNQTNKKILNEPGPDQVIHNYLIYNEYELYMNFIDNINGPVITVCRDDLSNIKYDINNKIINNNGIVNIIHQYDRHQILLDYVKNIIN